MPRQCYVRCFRLSIPCHHCVTETPSPLSAPAHNVTKCLQSLYISLYIVCTDTSCNPYVCSDTDLFAVLTHYIRQLSHGSASVAPLYSYCLIANAPSWLCVGQVGGIHITRSTGWPDSAALVAMSPSTPFAAPPLIVSTPY